MEYVTVKVDTREFQRVLDNAIEQIKMLSAQGAAPVRESSIPAALAGIALAASATTRKVSRRRLLGLSLFKRSAG